MKLFHLSDLHIGKRVHEVSMLEDQAYILDQILALADRERPDAVLICGDVYDKSVPSAEAVSLLDDFLFRLSQRKLPAIVISGNHDSPERLSFGGRLMEGSGIHLSPVYGGTVPVLTLHDEFGPVDLYSLPFIKPAHVKRFFPEEEIGSYTDAVAAALPTPDPHHRSVLLTHQFVTGASRCESEELSVGGSDNVDASVFEAFDYVALGHIHGPQNIIPNKIRYCGTPLKYSFSEAHHHKSVTLVELAEKGAVRVDTLPLVPRRDLREVKGTYLELTARDFYEKTSTEDYLHIILTDEEDVPEAIGRLRAIYPNILKLSYDNRRTKSSSTLEGPTVQTKSPLELFGELYELQNNQPMSQVQSSYLQSLMELIWEETP